MSFKMVYDKIALTYQNNLSSLNSKSDLVFYRKTKFKNSEKQIECYRFIPS
jgi:hypothetical protein